VDLNRFGSSRSTEAAKVTSFAPKKIGIMGPFGGGNLGDAAIQQAMIENIRKHVPRADIYGFSLIPHDTEKRHGIPSFPIGRLGDSTEGNGQAGRDGAYQRVVQSLRASRAPLAQSLARWLVRAPMEWGLVGDAYGNLKGFDLFIVSGGGQLDDYWGGPFSHPYTLLKFAVLARMHGAKVMFVSVGAGPIDSPLSARFIRWALSLASYRSYRDEPSKQLIAGIGFENDADPIYPDLAHSLPIEAYLKRKAEPTARRRVGVGPMAYFDPRVWPQRDQTIYMGYLAKLADIICWLLEERNRDVLLFTGEAEHDRLVIDDLWGLLAARGVAKNDERIIEPPIATVDDLMTQLATTEQVVASRFHGVLLAQLLDKPVLALSYHSKIDTLMTNMGAGEYCLPIDSFAVDSVKRAFLSMEAESRELEAKMAAQNRRYRDALAEQYRRIFASVQG